MRWRIKVHSEVFLKWITNFIHWACLLRAIQVWSLPMPTAALVWFHIYLIPSNPGAFVFILNHHKRTRGMTGNRTWVNMLGFQLIWCAAKWMIEGLHTDTFEEKADCKPFICCTDCTHFAQLHCMLTLAPILQVKLMILLMDEAHVQVTLLAEHVRTQVHVLFQTKLSVWKHPKGSLK